MEEFMNTIYLIRDNKTIFVVCGIFITFDIITGYLKAFKLKKVNSSISRDGYIKKIGWIVALLFAYLIRELIKIDLFIILTSIVCIATEGISVYENLGEIGINLKFKKYFEKLKDMEDQENDK